MNPIENENLTCPITMEILEDPITLPCGHSVSRQPMVLWFQNSQSCPVCKTELDNYDPQTAPKSINLAYMIELVKQEQAKNENIPVELFKPKEESKWNAIIHPLSNNENVYQTVIGKMEISNTKKDYFFKTLLIPIVDKSGSMSGSPTKQVIYSLNRIIDVTYKLPQIMTTIIHYDDRAINMEINKLQPIDFYRNYVQTKTDGGGTSFRSAFDELIKVCEKHKNDKEISSMVVIFLTDGEDSSVQKNARNDLVKSLKIDIEKIWDKQYTVHTVGFGSGHDYDFLNGLRQIGTEGAYRFADPNEDADSLSNKINSLLDVIAESSTMPLKIISMPATISLLNGENGKYWIDITKCDRTKPYNLTISINDELTDVPIEFAEGENDKEIWNQWYTYLIDEIASEILILSTQPDSLDKQLHIELLQQRSRAIFARLNDTVNAERLEKLVETLKTIQIGGTVNQSKLNDMKFEGKYATKSINPQPVILPSPSIQQQNTYVRPIRNVKYWKTIKTKNYTSYLKDTLLRNSYNGFYITGKQRFDTSDESHFSNHLATWVDNNSNIWFNKIDEYGSTSLIVASACGRWGMIKAMLKYDINIDHKNNDGYNALDIAILYGYYNTVDILLEHGIKPSVDTEVLLCTCLSNGYYQTAERLVKNKLVSITEDLINCSPYTYINWLSARATKNITLETAITKGLYDAVEEKLNIITDFSWKPYLDILSKPTTDQVRIIDLLLKNKKADPHEIIEIDFQNNNNEIEKEITFPLFIACEKGQYQLFKLLLKYIDDVKSIINFQNNKGTTLLWIASCNRYIDIVNELLNLGADPNVANLKGDGPLIPCCQKGSDVIVDLLLESGARLNIYNKNRDNPVLICCRTGQYRILETLLKRLNPAELKIILEESAEIDGFNPLLASTELDKVECIKVCKKYGADLEHKTTENNQIIAGATALHLACFYGRLAATKTLLELGSDITSQTSVHGWTPLHIAIRQGHVNIVRFLLSHSKGKQNLEITDKDNRTPSYYANINGNESILEEFFTNKLSLILDKVLLSDQETEFRCSQTLLKYGRSLGCFEYDEIAKINMGQGSTILSNALLSGNKHLINSLKQMNPNFNKPDDYGVTPNFWATFLGYSNDTEFGSAFAVTSSAPTELGPSDATLMMLDRVKSVGKTSLQNKLLLNLQPGRQLIEAPNQINSLIKMSDGYSLRVNNGVLVELKNSQALDHSLLGFVDKLKNNKVFPDGKQQLESILYNSKIHLIKLVATEDSILQPIHLLALYLYTGNLTIFKQVNITLSNWKPDNFWNPFIHCLYQGIGLLSPYIGEVYRAVDTSFNSNDYKVGTKIKWSTFSICSLEWKNSTDLINQKKGIVFIIKSLSGKNISRFSKSPADKEVIFLPGTEFVITNFYKPDIIVFGQANIRQKTYKATDKDLENATNQKDCIIIELEECKPIPTDKKQLMIDSD